MVGEVEICKKRWVFADLPFRGSFWGEPETLRRVNILSDFKGFSETRGKNETFGSSRKGRNTTSQGLLGV